MRRKIGLLLMLAVVSLVSGVTGFLYGTITQSKRSAISSLFKHVAILREMERGDFEHGESLCRTFITGNYLFINSEKFGSVALRGRFSVDAESSYGRVEAEAKSVSDAFMEEAEDLQTYLRRELGNPTLEVHVE